ncbi:MAG: DUF4177 domain-containing protein [Desulfovibrionaceae bacterium]|nr:DUF4177 domain-containing protein [Desulfovibrionaceae bacterium]
MTIFEYHVETTALFLLESEPERLNHFSAQGWELVGVVPYPAQATIKQPPSVTLFFKRPRAEQPCPG